MRAFFFTWGLNCRLVDIWAKLVDLTHKFLDKYPEFVDLVVIFLELRLPSFFTAISCSHFVRFRSLAPAEPPNYVRFRNESTRN